MADLIAANAAEAAVAQATTQGETSSAQAASSRDRLDFSGALAFWSQASFPELLANLASVSPQLLDAQASALVSRKRLAEQTREFKKIPSDDAKLEAIRPLLKAYQAEIDSLTKRAKNSESAFLGVWDRIRDAPDPYPLLELVVDQTAALSDLKTEAASLRSENSSLRNSQSSLEAENRRLTARISTGNAALEAEISAKWEERLRGHVAREEELSRSLSLAQSQLRELRAAHAKATERLVQRGEEVDLMETNGRMEELEVVAEDLRRTNDRLAAAQMTNDQLRAEIEALKGGHADRAEVELLTARLAEAEDDARRVAQRLHDEEEKSRAARQEDKRRLDEAARQLSRAHEQGEALSKKLAKMVDYDEVKRELSVLKFVELSAEEVAGEDGGLDDQIEGRSGPSSSSLAKPLETLLVQKNRKLQEEVTTLRVQSQETSSKLAARDKETARLRDEVDRLRKLNQRLEDDLLNVDPVLSARRPSGAAKDAEGSESRRSNGRASPIPFEGASRSGASGAATPSGNTSSSSILPIITSQRDRFRARNAELEEELRKQFETITELRNEVKTLQADNLSLYEKVRYLQAYGAAERSVGGSSQMGAAGPAKLVSSAARIDVGGAYPPARSTLRSEDKYRDRYEASVNPFEAFRGREQSRALASLNPLERLLHMLTRLVLGHRRMRLLFMVYAVCLHLLVFAMLFELGHSSTSARVVAPDPIPPLAAPVDPV